MSDDLKKPEEVVEEAVVVEPEKVEEVKAPEPEKVEEAPKVKNASSHLYKGYDIKWLRDQVGHPDYYLVAEYDNLPMKGGE